jgi:hypothetical protein
VEADKSITDLITYHLPDCSNADYVKIAIEMRKQNTGRVASFADCAGNLTDDVLPGSEDFPRGPSV